MQPYDTAAGGTVRIALYGVRGIRSYSIARYVNANINSAYTNQQQYTPVICNNGIILQGANTSTGIRHDLEIPDNVILNELAVEAITPAYTHRISVYNEAGVLICDNGVAE